MKNLISKVFIVTFTVLFAVSLYAAEPQTKAGSKSMYWGLNGLSELSFDNSSLGIQYLFADKMGIWVDLDLSMISDKATSDADGISTSNFGLSAGFIYYLFQKGPVALYGSPQVGFSTSSVENKDAATTHIDSKTKLHLGVSVGVEWWFTDNVSLTVTTLLGFVSETNKVERGSSTSEATTSTIGIMPNGSGKFLISFYF